MTSSVASTSTVALPSTMEPQIQEKRAASTSSRFTSKRSWTNPWRRHTTPLPDLLAHPYKGTGTETDPFAVEWIPADVENPMTWSNLYKWTVTMLAATTTLAVTMGSSMLSAAIFDIEESFPGYSSHMYVMVTSAFVLGFVFGPLLWAPLSEVFGRRPLVVYTFMGFTIFDASVCGAPTLESMLVLRFFAGFFGSSALTNAGGTIADMFDAEKRGLAMAIFAAAPFLGPAIGPVAGGFLSQAASWQWVGAVIALFSALLTALAYIFMPETYAPTLLRARAADLSKATGNVYRSQQDVLQPLDKKALFTKQIIMPWILLFREPIVLLMSLYIAVIYALLYLQFAALPIVFVLHRHWTPGFSGLAFVGITVGSFIALAYIIFYENKRYARKIRANGGYLPPEERLPSVMVGAVLLPVGIFIFAWTATPETIPWIAPILATVPFGAGIVLLFLGIMNYLVDTYLLFAASVLAANAFIRSAAGVIVPLFTTDMYTKLGVNWASSLLGFLTILFLPCPIIFYIMGRKLRRASKFGRMGDDMGQMFAQQTRAKMAIAQTAAAGATGGVVAAEAVGVEEEGIESAGALVSGEITRVGSGVSVALSEMRVGQ